MIRELDEQECWQLVGGTTIGRVGCVVGDRILVLPVNYLVDDDAIVIRTSPDGELARAGAAPGEVAFEVDHHDRVAGIGWSVLMNGVLEPLPDEKIATLAGTERVIPWAGGDRSRYLRFTAHLVSGRSVRRERHPRP